MVPNEASIGIKHRWIIDRLRNRSLFHILRTVLTVPSASLALLHSTKLRPEYHVTLPRKLGLGFRFFWNTVRIPSGSSYKAHLAMALKLFEMSPPTSLPGAVLECGTWKGASAANLSIVCGIVGRELFICDSFEGLPEPIPGTQDAKDYAKGEFAGSLKEVTRNVEKYGNIKACKFIKGWFDETLPTIATPIALAWVDVDLEESLETCVVNIWPNLVEEGFLFLDECASVRYVALFFSERWWQHHFDRTPPGFIGAGTGLGLGNYYIGPLDELSTHRWQHSGTAGYTSKVFEGYWNPQGGPDVVDQKVTPATGK